MKEGYHKVIINGRVKAIEKIEYTPTKLELIIDRLSYNKSDEFDAILSTKKEVSFLHSGHLGDIINSLPLIKEISKNKNSTKQNYLK